MDSGRVQVYAYDESHWNQLGTDIDGESAGDYSGYDLSMSADGTIIAIGAPYNDGNGYSCGHVQVYSFVNSDWTQMGMEIDGETAGDESGRSVSSSNGLIFAIGAPYNDGNGSNSGHTRVYSFVNSDWTQLGIDIDGERMDIDGKSANEFSGRVISISSKGLIVAIGSSYIRHVRAYSYNGSQWDQVGVDIYGKSADDLFSNSVSI